MHNSDRLFLSKFSLNADYDSFFEEEDLQDFEYDEEINQLLGATDFDETDAYFRNKISLRGTQTESIDRV